MKYSELVMHKLKDEHEYTFIGEISIFESKDDIKLVCKICKEEAPKPYPWF